VRDLNGDVVPNPSLWWSSTDTRIASVNNKGKVTARLPGTVRIRAKSSSVTGEATITVTLIG
jgi:uncharacterized protein YjdB